MASALVQGDMRYALLAVEHVAQLLGLVNQGDASEWPTRSDRGVQAAIRKAPSDA